MCTTTPRKLLFLASSDDGKISLIGTPTAAATLYRILPDLMTDVLPLGFSSTDFGDKETLPGLYEDVDEVLRPVDALHATAAGVEELAAAGTRQREGLGFEDVSAEARHGVDVEEVAL